MSSPSVLKFTCVVVVHSNSLKPIQQPILLSDGEKKNIFEGAMHEVVYLSPYFKSSVKWQQYNGYYGKISDITLLSKIL